jgi:geranylgeranylglycerol-phosphate geranylgeranyltransferase
MASLAVLVGFLVAAHGFAIETLYFKLFLGMVSVFLFAGAGIVINDYYDYYIDKINAPHRPLPSGKIKRGHSLLYSYLLFLVALLLSLYINPYCLALALINIVLEVYYAKNFKRTPFIGNTVDSWFVASSFLYGAFIVGIESLHAVPLLASLAFLSNVGREIFGDIEDIKGDKKLGLRTLPIVIGAKKARLVATTFIISAIVLSPFPWLLGLLNINYLFVVALADVVFIYSLFVDPKRNQRFTKIAMVLALAAFLVGVM